MQPPVLYSFRRCLYAMRARLALASSGVQVELREVVLRDKPEDFLKLSPSATVPCLATPEAVIDESFDIMIWALRQSDPEGWLDMPDTGFEWITRCDGPFKNALDRTKYATRYPDEDPDRHRALASDYLRDLDRQVENWIFDKPTLADFAILPFVRQFAFIDKPWFDAQPWTQLQQWLERFLSSPRFAQIMPKYTQWKPGDTPVLLPASS